MSRKTAILIIANLMTNAIASSNPLTPGTLTSAHPKNTSTSSCNETLPLLATASSTSRPLRHKRNTSLSIGMTFPHESIGDEQELALHNSSPSSRTHSPATGSLRRLSNVQQRDDNGSVTPQNRIETPKCPAPTPSPLHSFPSEDLNSFTGAFDLLFKE